MADLGRQGAFYNYSIACDATTTTQNDIDRGIVNVRIAFAPEKPDEFIVLELQQQAGPAAA
jgi:phage tail sheath protein FI